MTSLPYPSPGPGASQTGRSELEEGIAFAPRFDADGLIADFTVMLRPLSALVPFAQAMGERAQAAGLQTTRA